MATNENPRVVRSHDIVLDRDYSDWIQEIKQRFRNSQIKAAVKVNSEQLLFNWQLGIIMVYFSASSFMKETYFVAVFYRSVKICEKGYHN